MTWDPESDPGIVTRALSAPPVDTTYRWGRWHRDRATLRGVRIEARVWASGLLRPGDGDRTKFLIVSRARSGSTLLTQLLNDHPDIACDREVLARSVLAPAAFLDRLAAKARRPVYGAKLLSYQMVQVQRFRDPRRFLGRLVDRGFRLVHLQRDSFAQTLSLAVAQARRHFHHGKRRKDAREGPARIVIPPGQFADRLEWNALLLDYERYCLAPFDPVRISYEADLMTPEAQARTANRLFEALGVGPHAPTISLKKLLSSDPRDILDNYDAVAEEMGRRGMGALLSRTREEMPGKGGAS